MARWGGPQEELPEGGPPRKKSIFASMGASSASAGGRKKSIFGGLVGGHESEAIRPSRRISVFAARYSTSDRPRKGMGVFKRISHVLGQLDKRLGEKYEPEEGLTLEILLEEITKSKMYCKDVLMKPRHSKTRKCSPLLRPLTSQMQ